MHPTAICSSRRRIRKLCRTHSIRSGNRVCPTQSYCRQLEKCCTASKATWIFSIFAAIFLPVCLPAIRVFRSTGSHTDLRIQDRLLGFEDEELARLFREQDAASLTTKMRFLNLIRGAAELPI